MIAEIIYSISVKVRKFFGFIPFVVFPIVICILVIGIGWYIIAQLPNTKFQKQPEISFALAQDKSKAEKQEVALVDWVFEHSDKISRDQAKEIVRDVIAWANKPLLILAIMKQESDFVQSAVSSKGAKGLMQPMFSVHGKELIRLGIIKEERDLFNIIPNIRSGDYVLELNLRTYKYDVSKALEGYLGGHDGYYVGKINANLVSMYVKVQEAAMKPPIVDERNPVLDKNGK